MVCHFADAVVNQPTWGRPEFPAGRNLDTPSPDSTRIFEMSDLF